MFTDTRNTALKKEAHLKHYRKVKKDMTAEQLRKLGYNEIEIAQILETNKKLMWEKLLEMGISEETLQIVTDINGYTEETLEAVLYVAFGERSFKNV